MIVLYKTLILEITERRPLRKKDLNRVIIEMKLTRAQTSCSLVWFSFCYLINIILMGALICVYHKMFIFLY